MPSNKDSTVMYEDNGISFICFGDWGVPPTHEMISLYQNLHRHSLDFIILLGDNFYPDGISNVRDRRWKDALSLFPSGLRLYAILGNHDYHSNPEAQISYTTFPMNRTWKMPYFYYDEVYSAGHGHSAHFLFIDTMLLSPHFTRKLLQMSGADEDAMNRYERLLHKHFPLQLRWLEDTLSKSTSRWKIVCGHYPILSGGPHTQCPMMVSLLGSLLQKYNVDLYISGHDHNAQMHRIGNIYSIISGSFASVYPSSLLPSTMYINDSQGYFNVRIHGQQMIIQFINQNNSVVFEHCIRK